MCPYFKCGNAAVARASILRRFMAKEASQEVHQKEVLESGQTGTCFDDQRFNYQRVREVEELPLGRASTIIRILLTGGLPSHLLIAFPVV